MANSSELLHFLKSDRHITAFSLRAQDILAESVHNAFKLLVSYFQSELEMCMPTILSESEDDDQATLGIMKVCTTPGPYLMRFSGQEILRINQKRTNKVRDGLGTYVHSDSDHQ